MNVFIVGLQKTGTSAISFWFDSHKQVDHSLSQKDVHFVSELYRGLDKNELIAQFEETIYKENCLRIAVNYWMDDNALRYISEKKLYFGYYNSRPC